MPYPYILSGKTARSPDRRTSSIISFAVSSGQACHRQATIPHIIGEEKEVPLAWRKLPSVPITSEPRPTATTSGFTRPSAVFPTEENGARTPYLFTAPTVITFSASPGGVIFFHEPDPEFPALHTTTIPLSAAFAASRDINA